MALISGTGGNDTLNGLRGADTLIGGAGNDTYLTDGNDTIIEDADQGTDTVQSILTYTLGANLENLVLSGIAAISGMGNELANTLTGNSGNNSLYGDAGDDVLNGGGGSDALFGGTGNDTYIIDGTPGVVIIEDVNQGIDTVHSSGLTYTLGANLENLVLIGLALNGYGNDLDNSIIGNASNNNLYGFAGNDIFTDSAGRNTMYGGLGDDRYVLEAIDGIQNNTIVELANEGIDTVYGRLSLNSVYQLGANIENFVNTNDVRDVYVYSVNGNELNNHIIGSLGIDIIRGGAGDDVLFGGSGGGDWLYGDAGNDTLEGGFPASCTLVGGQGDDTYIAVFGDTIIEAINEGIDTVQSRSTFTLGANFENLVLTGFGSAFGAGNSLNNILTGNGGNNVLFGADGNDTLYGNAGNDTLEGGAGADTLYGGAGDDIYITDGLDTIIEDVNAGIDTIRSPNSTTLGAVFENLVLTGAAATNGTGNALDNMIIGNLGSNLLDGGAGNDTLDGGTGTDTLIGGAGNDTYVTDGGDTIREYADQGIDTVQSSVSYTLGTNLENLVLTGSAAISGIGNELANTLTGNFGNSTLIGGTGDDTYIIEGVETITEDVDQGVDTVRSSTSATLGANLENLVLTGNAAISGIGNELANMLTGNGSNSTLIGGAGDDTYITDGLDTIREDAGQGVDTVRSSVSYALGANLESLTLTGGASTSGYGNALANTLTGNSANNILDGDAGDDTFDGGTGTDTLIGGAGNDTYIIDGSDTIIEGANEGIDTVLSLATYTLGADLENLVLTGTVAINGFGNTLNNILTGNAAANTLNGGTGIDRLIGGLGDDIYITDGDDLISEELNAGTDTVQSSGSLTLQSNIENLVLTGGASTSGYGNALANTLTGNSGDNQLDGDAGDDILDGGTGTDTLIGGAGDDTYITDGGDTLSEALNAGTDTVRSSASYSLGSNLENLTLTGATAINGTGNTLNNVITGNDAANTLNGGTGIDRLSGGLGDDIYITDGDDLISEMFNAGTDTVQSSVSLTLGAGLENLVLTGTAAINGTGNNFDNYITGNDAANTLFGDAGFDWLSGGLGDDIYITDGLDTITEAVGAGTDTVKSAVSLTLGSNLDDLVLGGASAINGTGNSLNNRITGNDAGNVLNGGTGIDQLSGGLGDDTYITDGGDVISESLNAGTDTVQSSASYTLVANLENLVLTGGASTSGYGNALANTLTGNGSNNLLDGGAGNDTLDGGTGTDTLIGGAGNDTYITDGGDTITEVAGAGTDTVQSSATSTLGANVENLILIGSTAINGTGNTLNNILTGNGAANTLNGGIGSDRLSGGVGDDTYVTDGGDVISEELNAGIDTVRSSVAYTLGSNLENLILTGTAAINGIGNSLDNVITGNTAANTLNGGTGTDRLFGGLGDDLYITDGGDVIAEAISAGIDTVRSSATITLGANLENLVLTGTAAINGIGNSSDNTVSGNNAANTLNGGTGIDRLFGGLGDDIYITDGADVISEAVGAGVDTVRSSATITLGANLENLILTGTASINGTGNSLDNTVTGNSGANTLNGGTGIDRLFGGLGDDIYITDGGDVIAEALNGGTDTVRSSATITLAANLENLILTGTAAINGTGNALDNTVSGNGAANTLNGGTGTDRLFGGLGDDIYVTDGGDVIAEALNAGTDTVQSSASITLGANLENLILTGTGAINGTGNELDNVITGNAAANTLNGGTGSDTITGGLGKDLLVGGLGADTFVFNTISDSTTASPTWDIITDFTRGQDKIDLRNIDAFVSAGADDAFLWNGSGAFSDATAGEARYQLFDNAGTADDYTAVFLDNNADATVEMAIRLNGLHNLDATDFLL